MQPTHGNLMWEPREVKNDVHQGLYSLSNHQIATSYNKSFDIPHQVKLMK